MRSLQRGRTADEEQFFTAPTGQPSDGTSAEQEAEEPAEEAEPYVSPVDFEALWAVNEDAYAWL